MDQTHSRLRPGHWLVVVAVLAAWVTWKIYRFRLMSEYGPFAWEYWRPTLILAALVAGVWVVSLLWQGNRES